MPNDNRYRPDNVLGEFDSRDVEFCEETIDRIFDIAPRDLNADTEDTPIFADEIPVLTNRLSAIELQIIKNEEKRTFEKYKKAKRLEKKGLMGGLLSKRRKTFLETTS